LTAEIQAHLEDPPIAELWSQYFDIAEARALRNSFAAAVEQFTNKPSEKGLVRIEKFCSEIKQKWQQLTMQAREICLQANLEAQASTLVMAESLLASLSKIDSVKFDAPGREQCVKLLSQAGEAVNRRDSDASSQLTRSLWQTTELHIDMTLRNKGAWELSRNQARNQKDELSRRIESLRCDETVLLWNRHEIEHTVPKLEALERLFGQESFAEISEGYEELNSELDQIEAETLTADLKERRRQHIVTSMSQILQTMGFNVSENLRSDPASDVVLNARRLNGGAVSVSVPQEGELLYDLAGFERSQILGSRGKPVAICDDAESMINDFHAELSSVCGVDAGPLRWDDQDPDRLLKTAKVIPTDSAVRCAQS
jgi:hypothetical protein